MIAFEWWLTGGVMGPYMENVKDCYEYMLEQEGQAICPGCELECTPVCEDCEACVDCGCFCEEWNDDE